MNDAEIILNATRIRNKLLDKKQSKASLKQAYRLIGIFMNAVSTASFEINVLDRRVGELQEKIKKLEQK